MNNRNSIPNNRKYPLGDGMYPSNTNFPPHTVQATNSSGRFNIIGPQQAQRHYGNPSTHNISDMKSNHMANISQMQITHIPQRQPTLPHHIRPNAPRNLPRGPFQYQVYLPGNVAYSGTPNHAYYPHTAFGPQASQAVIMSPYLQNYPGNQGFIYSTTPPRPLQQMTTSIPQGPQNTPVPNMSNAQSSHGPPLIVQSQSMEMSTNSQPLQVTQQPPTTPMPIPEPRAPRRKTAAIKIIDPNTGNEIDLNNTSTTPTYNLNGVFDNLKALTNETNSKIPLRIINMIRDVIQLRNDFLEMEINSKMY